MYGALIGDIVGSKFEFNNHRSKDFPFVSPGCSYTDDSIMTVAVARALLDALEGRGSLRDRLVFQMQALGKAYPYPQGGYGGRFFGWLNSPDPQPYHSCGNGSAMRASACGLIAVTLEEALALAEESAAVTHDHPEGIKGAQALAVGVFLARQGKDKAAIRAALRQFYHLEQTLDEIRPGYGFGALCQNTVPEANEAFLESESYEDAIRNAISLGGDSDTIGAITGGIAQAVYGIPRDLREAADVDGASELVYFFQILLPVCAPIIATLAMEQGIRLNIISADTRSIGEKTFGEMVLGLPTDETEAARALIYLREINGITAEEVTEYVQ
jgi:ADP-ribosylglycohydrolase